MGLIKYSEILATDEVLAAGDNDIIVIAIVDGAAPTGFTTKAIKKINLVGGAASNFAVSDLVFSANRTHDLANFTFGFTTGFAAATTNTTEDVLSIKDSTNISLFSLKKNGGISIGINAGNGAQCADLVAIGYHAGNSLGATPLNGFNSVFVGAHTGEYTTTAINTINIGEYAGQYNNGDGNVNVGIKAGQGTALYSGTNNVFLGPQAGEKISLGNGNIGLGFLALGKVTASVKNIGIGVGAGGYLNTYTGEKNISIGDNAGAAYTTATGNIVIGVSSGVDVQTGNNNVFIGEGIGDFGAGETSGDDNLCLGQFTGYSLKAGNNNTLVGVNTGQYVSSGSNNVFLGHNISNNANKVVTGSFNVIIGNNIAPRTNDPSNYLNIGGIVEGDMGVVKKLGFFATAPIAQPSSVGEVVGFVAGAGASVNSDSTFTGNVGATSYTVSDVVKHLKNLGLITQ